LFDKENDPLDENDLSHDKNLLKEYREKFINHLKEENHPHLLKDGKLLNLHKKVTKEDYTNVIGWMGL